MLNEKNQCTRLKQGKKTKRALTPSTHPSGHQLARQKEARNDHVVLTARRDPGDGNEQKNR